MTAESKRQRVRAFVARFSRNPDLPDDADIFAMGIVNSLFAMQLVLFLEKEFAFRVENQDLDFENFRTINAMVSLIERKLAAASNG